MDREILRNKLLKLSTERYSDPWGKQDLSLFSERFI